VGDDPVFIVEGEKDVESLRVLGLTATCNPMGAGKWRSSFDRYLGGRDVIILPDNDEPGKNHARQVAASLKGFTKSTKVAELPGLPDKGDVSDFVNLPEQKQINKQQFLELVNELAKPWADQGGKTLTLIKGCNVHYPPREPIVKGFPLYKKFVYLLSGDQGDYKSILTLHTCRCVVSAQYDLFGKYKVVEKGAVILFDEETPEPIMEERLQGFGLKDPDLPFYLCHFSGLQVDDDQWVEEVLRKIDEIVPVFAGFDSFIDFHTQDENSPRQMQQVMKRIRKIANTGPAVWLIAHNSKEAKLTRGTTAIPAAVDMEFFTKVSTKKEVTLEVRKNRVEPFEPIVVVPKFEPTSFRVDYKQTKDQDTWDVIEGLLSNEPISVAGIMQGLEKANVHVEEKTVRNILTNQVSAGLVKTGKIKIDITLADKRVQRRNVEHFWK
jgi:5S rRNA maturation endonuclease (ribonuclease M5)